MLTFRVDDMTCGHCASSITKAIRAVDNGARVEVNLQQHLVLVEPTEADAQELSDAMTEAGYTPVALRTAGATAGPKKAGSCCGCCH